MFSEGCRKLIGSPILLELLMIPGNSFYKLNDSHQKKNGGPFSYLLFMALALRLAPFKNLAALLNIQSLIILIK